LAVRVPSTGLGVQAIISVDPEIVVGILGCSVGIPMAGAGKIRVGVNVSCVRPATLNITIGNRGHSVYLVRRVLPDNAVGDLAGAIVGPDTAAGGAGYVIRNGAVYDGSVTCGQAASISCGLVADNNAVVNSAGTMPQSPAVGAIDGPIAADDAVADSAIAGVKPAAATVVESGCRRRMCPCCR